MVSCCASGAAVQRRGPLHSLPSTTKRPHLTALPYCSRPLHCKAGKATQWYCRAVNCQLQYAKKAAADAKNGIHIVWCAPGKDEQGTQGGRQGGRGVEEEPAVAGSGIFLGGRER